MIAYKFTRPGARSAFTDFTWPEQEWVDADGPLELCRNGIHACRVPALPRWVADELWLVELDGVEDDRDGVVLARRGRLVERVDAWHAESSRDLARACARRARQLADAQPEPLIGKMADDIAAIAEGPDPSATALAMYCTAHAFDLAVPGGYDAERGRQADWLREQLGLAG